MTTLAKIEANQRNGQLSTGPRTAEGKATVARNATKHGIFSAVPVIPGEDPQVWETHRAGVVESLAPVGLLEVNLAERAALLLWRLQRLARYEAETVAAAMEEVEVPALPAPTDSALFSRSGSVTREDQLRDIREELRTARQELVEVVPARDFFVSELAGDVVVAVAVVESIMEAAFERVESMEDRRADPPAFASKRFVQKFGLTETDTRSVSWTADLIRCGLLLYASYTRESAEQFVEAVRVDMEAWAEELTRKVRRLEQEASALVRLLDGRVTRKQVAKLLPGDGRDERIAKYERHLHSLLTSTLHELERLQARREGQAVPPPAVADVHVTVDAGSG